MKKATRLLAPLFVFGLIFGTAGLTANADSVTIDSGETLYGIAQDYDMNVDELVELNEHIDPYAIPVGTEVHLSSEEDTTEEDTVTHTVQPGNTLNEISSLYDGVTVDDIYSLNEGIDPYNLTIGSNVVVVDQTESNGDTNEVYHTVQPGNTFFEIASVYDGVTVDEVEDANPDIDPYSLVIGSQLNIPVQ